MAAANEMKAILLEILEQAFQPADVTATQQMGVNMSNSVREKGVVIIQNQNVEVYARIMPAMVRALRLCDSFEPAVAIAYEPLQIVSSETKGNPEYTDPLDTICEYLFSIEIGLEAMQALIRSKYIEFVLRKFNTKREAADFLGIGPTYLSKLTANKEISE